MAKYKYSGNNSSTPSPVSSRREVTKINTRILFCLSAHSQARLLMSQGHIIRLAVGYWKTASDMSTGSHHCLHGLALALQSSKCTIKMVCRLSSLPACLEECTPSQNSRRVRNWRHNERRAGTKLGQDSACQCNIRDASVIHAV